MFVSDGVSLLSNEPYKYKNGDCPWQWCASSARTEKPKVAIMVAHFNKPGFICRSGSLGLFFAQNLY